MRTATKGEYKTSKETVDDVATLAYPANDAIPVILYIYPLFNTLPLIDTRFGSRVEMGTT